MSKIKLFPKLYTFQANVYNERFGSQFGKTVSITIQANNEKNAYKEATINFNKYINALYKHHNIDADGQVRKVINTFNYDNLKLL